MPGILDLADQSEHSTSNGASDAGMHTHSFGIKQIDPMHENKSFVLMTRYCSPAQMASGSRVVDTLLQSGFSNIRCFV
jgi:hypothetical protein